MAERELSILVRAKGALQAAREIGSVDKSVNKLGQTSARTIAKGVGIERLAEGAVRATGRAIHGGLESLAQLEDAESSVQGAIKQAGLAGKVSAKQVSGWANEIEASVQAAFDDKAITQAAATLIRFGKVTPANLKPALVVMTDLATKTGDIESASTLLAKALADPAKAAGKLARVGLILTKSQQDEIKAFMKAGDAASAQGVILDALAKTTAGAAKASAGPYRDSLNILTDVTEDAQRALATGFLPVITKVRDLLSTELAKPQTLDNIKKFGEFLAGGLGTLIDTARGLPWNSIGAALQLGGMGAKAILDAFSAMPPWVQTAIITGWGLNKLSGGAVTGIIGELGKGLIKGVLGMNAGVVNINAGVVNGASGVGGAGAAGAVGAAGGLRGALGTAASVVSKVVVVGMVAEVADLIHGVLSPDGGLKGRTDLGHELPADQLAWPWGPRNTPDLNFGPLEHLLGGDSSFKPGSDPATLAAIQAQTNSIQRGVASSERTESITSQAAAAAASRDSALLGSTSTLTAAARSGLSGVIAQVSAAKSATTSAAGAIAAATRSAAAATTQAVKDKDLSVKVNSNTTVNVTTRVSVRETIKQQTTAKKYGNVYIS